MNNKKMKKEEKGITLVALVVTIVVLLILAGISLNLVIGNEGILTRSKDAADKYGKQTENEQQGLNDVDDWMDEQFGGIQKVTANTKATKNGTINGQEPNTNNPLIPKGYTPIDAGDAKWGDGSSSPAQSSVDNGLVIKDDNDNEWVWVPVEASVLSSMYTTSTKTEGEIISGDMGVTTKLYTSSTTIGRTGDTKTLSRNTPNTTDYREPDLIVGINSTDCDKNIAYYKSVLGYNTPKAMAEAFTVDYANMIASIQKYGGFYIGRYELSNEGVQKEKATLTSTNWYNLYKRCTTLNASDKIESKMIWGIQWDLACDFISKKGEQKSITNSATWGNYYDSTGNAAVKTTENGVSKIEYARKQVTGYSEYWKANNIYDLAGNYLEWTQEADGLNYRATRGGSYGGYSSNFPVSECSYSKANTNSSSNVRLSSCSNNKVSTSV